MEANRMSVVMNLLRTWRHRVRTNQRVHYARAEELERWHRFVGVPATVLSAAVGTSIFATLTEDVALWARLVVGFNSFVTAGLTALQTFFKFSERAAQHHIVAANYGAVNRAIERAIALPPGSVEAADKLIAELQKQMDDLPKQAPAIPDQMWRNLRPELTPEHSTGTANREDSDPNTPRNGGA